MAEDQEAGTRKQFRAARHKHLAPAMPAQGPPQIGAATRHHHTAFVELGQRVAQRAARGASLLPRRADCSEVAPVERRLGLRQGQPYQRVEQVMAVVGPRRHLAGEKGPLLVSFRYGRRRDKAQLRTAAGDQAALAGSGIQCRDIRRYGIEPGPQEGRKRVKLRCDRGHCRAVGPGAD
ncbi:MAG: hypothetical protein WCI19_01770 [Betaproteobacteria bacterium]|nr:hypothetical protein [Rhodocyclales bacterium]